MRRFLALLCVLAIAFCFAFPQTRLVVKGATLEENIKAIETELAEMGTDVPTELNKQLAVYRGLLDSDKTLSDEKKSQIEELALMTESLIFQYGDGVHAKRGWLKDNFMYFQAVASVVAYFVGNGYYLSAELLTHMQYNRAVDSIYTPVNVEQISNSSVFKGIKTKDKKQGSSRFPKQGGVGDMDLFYSLHQFSYVKFDEGQTIVIFDRYDYAPDGDFELFDNIPIQVMYAAQEAGVLAPYYVLIEFPSNVVADLTATENSDKVSREAGEYHLYDNACATACKVGGCAYVRTPSEHVDKDLDEICDECNEKLTVDKTPETDTAPAPTPEPEEPPTKEKENLLEQIKRGADELWGNVEEFMNGVTDDVQENLGSCSGSMSGALGGVSALALGIGLLFKRRKNS